MENDINKINQHIDDLKRDISRLENIIRYHKHGGDDESSRLITNLDLRAGQAFSVGNVARLTGETDTSDKSTRLQLISGNDNNLTDGQQVSNIFLDHITSTDTTSTTTGTNQSYFYGTRGPIFEGDSASIISGQSVMTQSDWKFKENILVGAFVIVQDLTTGAASNSVIISNTTTSITVSGAWTATLNNLNYLIFVPVYLGGPTTPWRKIYTLGGDGGIVFGFFGNSAQLYLHSDGTPHWIDPLGVDHQLLYL